MTASASDAHPYPIYNARYRVTFPLLDGTGALFPDATGLDSEASQDGGTFADCTNEATQIATSSGIYFLDLIASELDTQTTAIVITATGTSAKQTPIVLYPVRLPQIRTGTAQTGTTSSIMLDANASAIDDYYNGCYVNITNNSPANVQGQARRVTGYVGSTKVATVQGTYGTNPDGNSTFEVLATAEWVQRLADINALLGSAIATPTVAGVLETDVTHWKGTVAATVDTAGYPVVTIKDGTGAGEIALTGGAVDTVTSVTNRVTANVDQLNGVAQSLLDLKDFADDGYDPSTNKVQGVVLVDTLTTYTSDTPQTGDAFARLGAPAGASVSADIAGVQADTDDIQGRLPAALVGGKMDSDMTAISGDTAAADNLEKEYDGTGYGLILVRTTIATLASQTSFTLTAGSADNDAYNECVIVIEDASTAAQKAIGVISDYVGVSKTVTLLEDPAIFTIATTDIVTILAIRAGDVWDVVLASHLASGSTGNALNSAGSAGDPWSTALPGAYGAGTAGNILGTNLDTTVSSRASQTSLDTLDDFVDTEVAAIKAKTDQLTFTTANKVDATIQAAGDFAQAAADKVWSTASRTLTAFGFSVTVGTNSDKTGYSLSSAGIQAIWDALTSALTTAGSIGKLLVDNINATISSRATQTSVDTVDDLVDDLESRLTAPRAANLENLDATVSSRSTVTTAQVNAEVVDALATDTYAESATVPAATASLKDKIVWLATLARNKITQTSTTQALRNDADSADIATSTVSDDGATATRSEWS